MDDATKPEIAKIGEMIDCIDNEGRRDALTIGRVYEVRNSDRMYYTILNDVEEGAKYEHRRFIRYDPKPVFGHENANFDRPSKIEEWHSGDIVRVKSDSLPMRKGSQFTVNLFIRKWNAEKGHSADLSLDGLSGLYDVQNFDVIQKSPTRRTPDARPFWLVKGTGPSSYEHNDEESADIEARRLAKEHRGEVFTVLGPIRQYVVSDLQCHDLSEHLKSGQGIDNGLPF